MRLASLLRKTTLENLRDWKVLIMTLGFAPFFTVLMHFYFESGSQAPYRLAVVNQDEGITAEDATSLNLGEALIAELSVAASAETGESLRVAEEEDVETALAKLSAGTVDLVVVVPDRFTRTLEEYRLGREPSPSTVTTYGDPGNPRYLMAAAWNDAITYTYAAEVAEVGGPVEIAMQTISGEESLSEFDLYVPGLLALAIIMLMFTAAASIIKEKDKGTLIRLRMSNMRTFEWFLSVTLVQIVIGVCAIALTLGTAIAVGYEPHFSISALILVSAFSILAVVGVSVVVAAWLRTIFDLMTIGSFPFFILMFFSGGMFPLPDVRLFDAFGARVNLNDVLPTTHSISAFDQILNREAALPDVTFELAAIVLLSAVFFALGTLWFKQRHMSARTT